MPWCTACVKPLYEYRSFAFARRVESLYSHGLGISNSLQCCDYRVTISNITCEEIVMEENKFKFIEKLTVGIDKVDAPLRSVCHGLLTLSIVLMLLVLAAFSIELAAEYFGISDAVNSMFSEGVLIDAPTTVEDLVVPPVSDVPTVVPNAAESVPQSWACKNLGVCV